MKALGRGGDGGRGDRARSVLLSQPLGLRGGADAVHDHRAHRARRAGRRDGYAAGGDRAACLRGRRPSRRSRRSRRATGGQCSRRPGAAMYNDQAPERSIRDVRGVPGGAGARQPGVHPAPLPAPLVRLHPRQRLSLLQPRRRSPKRRHTAPISLSPSSGAGNSATGSGEPRQPAPRPHLPGQLEPGRGRGPPPLRRTRRSRTGPSTRFAAERGAEPLDVMLDLGLDEENLETTFIGQFLNVGDEGVARLLRHDAGVVALSDAGAHLTLHVRGGLRAALPRPLGAGAWRVRPRGRGAAAHEPPCGSVRGPGTRADRGGRLGGPPPVRPGHRRRLRERTGGGSPGRREAHPSAGRSGSTGVFCNGVEVFDGADLRSRTAAGREGAGPDRSGPVRSVQRAPPGERRRGADPRRLSLPRDGGGSPPRPRMVSEMRRSSSAAGCDDVLAITIPFSGSANTFWPNTPTPKAIGASAAPHVPLAAVVGFHPGKQGSEVPGVPGLRIARLEEVADPVGGNDLRPVPAAAAPVDDELPDEGEVAEGGRTCRRRRGTPPGGRR